MTDNATATPLLNINIDLPNKPSALIMFALRDLRAVEADQHYRVDMNVWHEPHKNMCSVCLAGAVMSRKLPPSQSYDPLRDNCMFDCVTSFRLMALDYFRSGMIDVALAIIDVAQPPDLPDRWSVPDYDKDPEGFRKSLRLLASELRVRGL